MPNPKKPYKPIGKVINIPIAAPPPALPEPPPTKKPTTPLIKRTFFKKEIKHPFAKIGTAARFIIFSVFFVIVLVFLAIFWVIRNDLSADTFSSLKARLNITWGSKAVIAPEHINFDAQLDNELAAFRDGLAVLTKNRFAWYDATGQEVLGLERTFKRPSLQTSAKNVLAIDRDGDSFVLANQDGFLLNMTWDAPLITARLNDSGWTTVVSQGNRYRSVVTVLDEVGKVVYKYYSPDYYILDAVLSPDCTTLVVSCATFENNWVSGRLKWFDISQENPIAESMADDALTTQLFFPHNDRVCAITERGLVFWDSKGERLGQTIFGDRVLLDYSVLQDSLVTRSAHNFVGNNSTLEQYNFEGELQATLALENDIICQSGDNNFLTLITSNQILVYNDALKLMSEEPNDTHVRQVLQRPNGTLFLVYNDYAQLYTP